MFDHLKNRRMIRSEIRSELYAEFEEREERMRLEVRREFKADAIKRDDQLAELKARLDYYKGLKYNATDLDNRQLHLDEFKARLDARENLVEIKEGHFQKVKEAHEADMERHHTEATDLQREAKQLRDQAVRELADAKSTARQAGRDEGYAAGLKDGYAASTSLVVGQRESYTSLVGLSVLAGTQGRTIATTNSNGSPTKAETALADAFAKHLTGTIDHAMSGEKRTK